MIVLPQSLNHAAVEILVREQDHAARTGVG
jgi:hypothetical protein